MRSPLVAPSRFSNHTQTCVSAPEIENNDESLSHKLKFTLVQTMHQAKRARFRGGVSKKDNVAAEAGDTRQSGTPKKRFTLKNQIRAVFCNSWINILLIVVPFGIAIKYGLKNPVATFTVNFVAIIPLASMIGFATEEIATHTGEVFGGLLNATFG